MDLLIIFFGLHLFNDQLIAESNHKYSQIYYSE